MIIGGKVPGGIRDIARLAIATTWPMAWPMSAPGTNDSSTSATCWMLRDSIDLTLSTYWNSSSNWLTIRSSIWAGLIPPYWRKT